MLPKFLRENRGFIAGAVFFFLMTFFYALPAYAQPPSLNGTYPTAIDMVKNIADAMPNLMRFTTAFAYVFGFYMVYTGVLKLKEFGEQRTQMSQQHHLSEPLGYLFTGALLIYLPTTVQVGLSTFWTNPNPYGYIGAELGGSTVETQWTQLIGACYSIIQLFGTIAFIRGLIILGKLGKGHSQETFGKGMAHVVGGILCINIYEFVQVVAVTLGFQTS